MSTKAQTAVGMVLAGLPQRLARIIPLRLRVVQEANPKCKAITVDNSSVHPPSNNHRSPNFMKTPWTHGQITSCVSFVNTVSNRVCFAGLASCLLSSDRHDTSKLSMCHHQASPEAATCISVLTNAVVPRFRLCHRFLGRLCSGSNLGRTGLTAADGKHDGCSSF